MSFQSVHTLMNHSKSPVSLAPISSRCLPIDRSFIPSPLSSKASWTSPAPAICTSLRSYSRTRAKHCPSSEKAFAEKPVESTILQSWQSLSWLLSRYVFSPPRFRPLTCMIELLWRHVSTCRSSSSAWLHGCYRWRIRVSGLSYKTHSLRVSVS